MGGGGSGELIVNANVHKLSNSHDTASGKMSSSIYSLKSANILIFSLLDMFMKIITQIEVQERHLLLVAIKKGLSELNAFILFLWCTSLCFISFLSCLFSFKAFVIYLLLCSLFYFLRFKSFIDMLLYKLVTWLSEIKYILEYQDHFKKIYFRSYMYIEISLLVVFQKIGGGTLGAPKVQGETCSLWPPGYAVGEVLMNCSLSTCSSWAVMLDSCEGYHSSKHSPCIQLWLSHNLVPFISLCATWWSTF